MLLAQSMCAMFAGVCAARREGTTSARDVRVRTRAYIQGVPGGMCQTLGECSLC